MPTELTRTPARIALGITIIREIETRDEGMRFGSIRIKLLNKYDRGGAILSTEERKSNRFFSTGLK